MILILIGILAIAFLVHYKLPFLNFFYLPVILSGYYLGKRQAVLSGIFSVVLVVGYLIISNSPAGRGTLLSYDQIINLTTWGSFLIITGAVVGSASEQRTKRLKNLRRAYIGGLEIMLKYLEVGDETMPRSLRVSRFASRIAKKMGLKPSEEENIKTAALLYDAGDLGTSLPFFEEITGFMEQDARVFKEDMNDREQVMLKTTAYLLKAIRPILTAYHTHYVENADKIEKDLENIPVGSSIISLADIFDRLKYQTLPLTAKDKPGPDIRSLRDVENLAGKYYPQEAVDALKAVTSA